jgi:ATP-binding cassette subfamily B protein
MAVAAMSRTGTFLLLRYLVDDVLDNARFDRLPLTALGFIGLAALEGSFTFLSGRWAAQTAEGITRRLRNYLFDHIQRLSFTYHDHTPTGDLIQRSTSDVDAVRRFFADQAINSWRIVLLFVVNFVGLISLSRQLALMSVAVVPFIIVVSI